MSVKKHIPNAITCCNLFSGCIAAVMAFQANYEAAILFIILGAIFDFFDGMLARLLNVSGPLGKELDSLADDITFGFAPSAIVFSLFNHKTAQKYQNSPKTCKQKQLFLPKVIYTKLLHMKSERKYYTFTTTNTNHTPL